MSGSYNDEGEANKVFVGGLDALTTENAFLEHFGQFGNMVDNVIIRNSVTRESRRFGFITYDSEEAVDRVLKADVHVIDGKSLEVKIATPRGSDKNNKNEGEDDTRECEAMRKMFVGGLNRETSEDTFCDHFGQYGNMVDKVIIKDPVSRVSRGFGFITYDSSDSVENVFQARPHVLDGKTLDVKRAMPRDYNTTTAHSKVTKLFIGGIGPDLTPNELQTYIENRHPTSIGTIDKIDFLKERETNKNKGFGFLECSDTDFADRLTISENSFTLKGKTMSLKKAEPKPSDRDGGGGGRGRGRGMGGRGGGGRGGYESRGDQRGRGRGGRGGSYGGGRSNNYDNGYGSQQNGYNDFSTGYPTYGANAASNTGYNSYQQTSNAGGGYGGGSSYGQSGSYGSQSTGGRGGWSSGGGGGGSNRYQPY